MLGLKQSELPGYGHYLFHSIDYGQIILSFNQTVVKKQVDMNNDNIATLLKSFC